MPWILGFLLLGSLVWLCDIWMCRAGCGWGFAGIRYFEGCRVLMIVFLICWRRRLICILVAMMIMLKQEFLPWISFLSFRMYDLECSQDCRLKALLGLYQAGKSYCFGLPGRRTYCSFCIGIAGLFWAFFFFCLFLLYFWRCSLDRWFAALFYAA